MGRPALAGRPCCVDHGGVDSAAAFLTQYEENNTSAVPRLGGMARANGVVIVSERYWAFAGNRRNPERRPDAGCAAHAARDSIRAWTRSSLGIAVAPLQA